VFDFRPVFKAKPAMAFITAYGAHCWEAFTLGSWMVAYLTFHLTTYQPGADPWLGPVEMATLAGLLGFPSSIIGNELCLRFGRRRMILLISLTSSCVSGVFGFLLGLPYVVLAIWTGLTTFCLSLDSGSIAYGMVQRAPKGYSAATMAMHSMAGFTAGLVGPFIFGAVLDIAGDTTPLGWGLAFLSIGIFALGAPLSMAFIGRRDDPGL
jgi:MFS family permease